MSVNSSQSVDYSLEKVNLDLETLKFSIKELWIVWLSLNELKHIIHYSESFDDDIIDIVKGMIEDFEWHKNRMENIENITKDDILNLI